MTVRSDYARSQDQLVRSAQSSLLDVWHASRGRDDAMLDGFVQTTEAHANLGGYVAEDYLMADYAHRGERIRSGRINVAAPSLEQIDGSGRWGIYAPAFQEGSGSTLYALQGALSRLVLQTVRDTVLNTVSDYGKKTRTAMARVPEAGACPFCLMLASRGAVYSKDTALSTPEGGKYHDHCRCSAIVANIDGSDLPVGMQKLNDQWNNYSVDTDGELSSKAFGKWLKEQG